MRILGASLFFLGAAGLIIALAMTALPLLGTAFFAVLGYSFEEIFRSNPELAEAIRGGAYWAGGALVSPVLGIVLIRKTDARPPRESEAPRV